VIVLYHPPLRFAFQNSLEAFAGKQLLSQKLLQNDHQSLDKNRVHIRKKAPIIMTASQRRG
jgi:hypothetical protein